MATSWHEKAKEFKSPLRVIAAFLLRSRETQATIKQRLKDELKERDAQRDQEDRQRRQQQRENDMLRQRIAALEKELAEAKQSINLPADPPLGTHG